MQIVSSHSSNERHRQFIDIVIKKLPKEVIKKIEGDKQPIIFLVGHALGDHANGIIVLNTRLMDEQCNEDKIQRVIAHEFAHFYLGHPPPMEPGMREKQEAEVNALLKQWGFK